MSSKEEVAAIYAKIAELRKEIALTESPEKIELLTDKIYEYRDQIRKINRKKPVVTAIKDAQTVGDKIERRMKRKSRRTASSYTRSTVRL